MILATVALTALPAFGIQPQSSATVSIAEARKLPLGTRVTIEGVVTVPSGAFKASFNDDGFAIQDNANGIYVSVHQNLNLTVGQRVRVTGKTAETNAQLRIVEAEATDIKTLGKKRAPAPKKVSTGQVNEETLGLLVSITGKISNPVASVGPFGFRIPLNDGSGEVVVFVSSSTKISQQGLQIGDRLAVTGFRGAFKGQHQIYPRFPADIKVIK